MQLNFKVRNLVQRHSSEKAIVAESVDSFLCLTNQQTDNLFIYFPAFGRKYLMSPYNGGPNFTQAPLTPALITPVSKIPFLPFRAGVKRAARYIY